MMKGETGISDDLGFESAVIWGKWRKRSVMVGKSSCQEVEAKIHCSFNQVKTSCR
jgi:hypothetical protein